MWILGGEASRKLKRVNLHGKLVRGVIGECGFKANGALSIFLMCKTPGGLKG